MGIDRGSLGVAWLSCLGESQMEYNALIKFSKKGENYSVDNLSASGILDYGKNVMHDLISFRILLPIGVSKPDLECARCGAITDEYTIRRFVLCNNCTGITEKESVQRFRVSL